MPKSDFIPTSDEEKAALFERFRDNIQTFATALGLSAEDIADQSEDTTWFRTVLNHSISMRDFATQWTTYKNLLLNGSGEALGIVGPDREPHDLSTLAPEISLKVISGKVDVLWNKNGMPSVEIQKDTGTGWQFLSIDTRPEYTPPLPLTPPPSGNTAPPTAKAPSASAIGATPRKSPWGDDASEEFNTNHPTPSMKTRILPYIIAASGTAIAAPDAADKPADPVLKPFEKAEMFLAKPYSSVLGYSLWNSDYLFEETFADPFMTPKSSESIKEDPEPEDVKDFGYTSRLLNKLEKEGKGYLLGTARYKDGSLKFEKFVQDEYEKRMLNKRLVFATDPEGKQRTNGGAVLIKLRDSFQLYNEAQPGFLLDYAGSSDDGESLRAKGALIADIYHPWLYNTEDMFPNTHMIHNPYEVVIRTGVEFDHDDLNTNKKDLTSYYLLANFQANPDQDWFAGPQFIQLGLAYDQDGITNEEDLRFIAAWQPVFFLDGFSFSKDGPAGQLFGVNVKQYFKSLDEGFMKFRSVTESASKRQDDEKKSPNGEGSEPVLTPKGNWYTWMPFDINFSNSSDILESLTNENDFGGATVGVRTGYGFGNDAHGLRVRYELNADFPLSEMSQSRISHAVIGELAVNIHNGLLTGDPKKDEPGSTHKKYGGLDTFSGMTIFAKWQTGEFDDTPGSHSEWSVGTRWRF